MESLEKCGRRGGVATVRAAVPDIIVKKARRALEGILKKNAVTRTASGGRQCLDCLAALYAQQFDVENQGGVRWNRAAGAACAIAQCCRDDQLALAAHFHALHAFVPTLNDAAGTQREFEWVVAVFARVKFRTGTAVSSVSSVYIIPMQTELISLVFSKDTAAKN